MNEPEQIYHVSQPDRTLQISAGEQGLRAILKIDGKPPYVQPIPSELAQFLHLVSEMIERREELIRRLQN